MPINCNSIRNEYSLEQSGTAQSSRPPLAFQPGYVGVDERTFADWIVFVRDYAKFVKYYNLNNTPDGDWRAFWSDNPAIVLANLAAAPITDFRKAIRHIFIELQKLTNQSNEGLLKQHLNLLFDSIATLAWQLDRHIDLLPDDLPIKNSLRSRINLTLAPALAKWFGWQKAAAGEGLLDTSYSEITPELTQLRILGDRVKPTEDFYTAPLSDLVFTDDWLTGGAVDWATYVDAGIIADASIFSDSHLLITVADRIGFAIRHFFFTSVYEQFLQSFALVVAEAEKSLHSLLYSWDRHEPHFALFLAFLRMLVKEQAYLNRLTDEHLRFYYERVLRLKQLAAKPAKAYVLVELAKHESTYLLKAGSELRAGKDDLGQEIIFGVEEDFIVNKAKVTELRSIFKAPDNVSAYLFGDPERPIYKNSDRNRYFAAKVSNSADGMGEVELSTVDGRWHPFGNRSINSDNNTWTIDIPQATVGFAIASHYLYMTQGERTLELKFNGSGVAPLLGTTFCLSLTTEKGWYETNVDVDQDPVDDRYRLRCTIPGNAPAILPYDTEVHQGNFDTELPVLKATLIHLSGVEFRYQALKYLTLESFDLAVEVIGKRNMALSGSTGPLDATKPFHPFGAAPEDGAVFTIGDKEVFQKKSTATLRLVWKEEYNYSDYYMGTTSYWPPFTYCRKLHNGQWSDRVWRSILPYSAKEVTATVTLTDDALIDPDFSPNTQFTSQSVAGFMRFGLSGDWGHRKYPLALAKYAKDGGTLPLRLYDPQVSEISLDYTANQKIPLNDLTAYAREGAQFFHIHPFGEAERIPAGGSQWLLPQLVPPYEVSTPDGQINNVRKDGGEWYIGIEGLVPPQELSLLIQLAPGTADPLMAKPGQHVSWCYLSENTWRMFAPGEVRDGTHQLLQSGLIRFSIPREANESHTLLPSGKVWLCASVETAVDAVNQVIGVHAQAVRVTLLDNSNSPNLGALPLKSGTINKLRQPTGAVKKIHQPYATFGGTAIEIPSQFYTRISERLRHKHRAITMWDYERILLQAFPQIHKIKCLNHLRYEPASTQPIYHELAPGHVTIIGVSDVRHQNGVNPLRPYLSLADLENIETYLRKTSSCFVKLHVRNPIFEPVHASLKVRLLEGYDETFYHKLLNDELIQFMSPWAFPGGKEIHFDGRIYKAALVNFVEERPYVDYLEDFVLSHTTDQTQLNVEEVKPTKQVSILVSSRQHTIGIIASSTAMDGSENCGCARDEGQHTRQTE